MRELSTAQQDLLLGTHFRVDTKVEVETSTGGYTDLGSLGGHDWFVDATIDFDINTPIAEARVRILREAASSANLSPLSTNSTFALDSCSAPLIDVKRELKISVATIPASCSPGSTDYNLLFRGDIDSVGWAQSPMELRARDPGDILQDQWVEDPSLYSYSTSSTSGLHQVVQDILTDWTTPAPTLLVYPTTPTFIFSSEFKLPDSRPVYAVLDELVGQIGYDLRYHWSSSGADFQLTLRNPQRSCTATPGATFGPDRYADVVQLDLDRTDVRNAISVLYYKASSTEVTEELVESTSSQDRFGRRWMQIVESDKSQINTSSEANDFANAMLDDLSFPTAAQEIDMHLWWPAELGDYYRWQGNDVHYTTDQNLAVTGYTHELSRDRHRTRIRTRGKPSGGYYRWHGRKDLNIPTFGGIAGWFWLPDNDVSLMFAAFVDNWMNGGIMDGVFFELTSGSTFVQPTTSSTFVSRTEMPYNQAQSKEILSGDTFYLWARWWNKTLGFGAEYKSPISLGAGTAILLSADCIIGDDTSTLAYQFTWIPDVGVTDAAHDVKVEGGADLSTPDASTTEVSPKTNTSKSIFSTEGVGGTESDWRVTLLNSTGGTVQTITGTSTIGPA